MNIKNEIKLIEKNKFASCIPLISTDKSELLADVEAAVKNECDFLEWRRDYYMKGTILSQEDELNILKEIKKRVRTQGLIYTYRSHLEGGVYETADVIREEAIKTAIESDVVDYVDVELESNDLFLERIKDVIKKNRTQWIASHHNFNRTPNIQEIEKIYLSMKTKNADVLKLAVMPHTSEDIRHLILSNLLHNEGSKSPMISIAMGSLGGITRIAPELCGGSMTYVLGTGKTAPGQMNLVEIIALREKLGLV